MSLTEIANDAAAFAAGKKLGLELLEKLKRHFEEPGFKGIENHLRESGFRVRRVEDCSGYGTDAVAMTNVGFLKNGLECVVSGHARIGQDSRFYFRRSDRKTSDTPEVDTLISGPQEAYPLIQNFVMDNLPRLSKPSGLMEYVKNRTFG